VILIFANKKDSPALRLLEAWRAHDARLFTPADLSRPGWNHRIDDEGGETAVVAGERVAVEAIRGVLTRLPAAWLDDLAHVVPEDREYVGAEMTAFLASWLTCLPCPVLNRPSAMNLMGPSHSPERWMAAAAAAGMKLPWASRRFPAPMPEPLPPPSAVTVSVLGGRCFGELHPSLAAQACRLAEIARAELLAVVFDGREEGATFLGAHLWPDVSAPELADALLARFGGAPALEAAS